MNITDKYIAHVTTQITRHQRLESVNYTIIDKTVFEAICFALRLLVKVLVSSPRSLNSLLWK